ncbi:MAG: hypothetical protein KY395_06465, partial [Actinobacteria bacterium]|nr:hypothetical protein [Actinomycetota bacterium]
LTTFEEFKARFGQTIAHTERANEFGHKIDGPWADLMWHYRGDNDIVDDEFEPPEIIVQRGDTVVWIHRGVRPHGVRASDGSFDSSPGCSFQNGESCMRNGDRYSRTFDEAGTFAYYCPVHGSANGVGMAGQVTVASGGGGGGSTTTTTSPPASTTQTTRSGTTTVDPPPPGGTTTQSPGVSPTPPPPPPPQGTTEVPPEETGTTTAAILRDTPSDLTTTSILAAPTSLDGDDSAMSLLILTIAIIGLAGALSAAAWYYRPRPGSAAVPPDPPAGP